MGRMQVCTSLQTDNHTSTHHSVFTGRMPFLPPNQQRQSTEGIHAIKILAEISIYGFVYLLATMFPGKPNR